LIRLLDVWVDGMTLKPPSRSQLKAGSRLTLHHFALLSVLVYLLAFTLPYWLPTYYFNVKGEICAFTARDSWRGILFYVAFAALFGCYLLAYRTTAQAKQSKTGALSVGLWTLAFCLLLIPVQTLTSSDVFGYLFQGRIVAVLGENPFVHVYKDFASDPFFFCVTFHGQPATSGYGPLWVAIEAGLGWLARDQLLFNLFLFKGLAAGLHLLGSALVYATLRRAAPEKSVAGMLFYAWNPLLLYELVGNAHNDAAVAALGLLGFYLLSLSLRASSKTMSRWGLLAFPCLTAAALIKPVALLWLPLAVIWLLAQRLDWSGRLRWAAAIPVLVILPAVIAYAPFWAGATTFRGLLIQSDIHGNTLPNLLIWSIWSVWPHAREPIVQGVKAFTVLLFVPFYAWQLLRVWRSGTSPRSMPERREGMVWSRLVRASFDVMLFYLLFVGFQFWPWYLTWLMVPAALLNEGQLGRKVLVPRRLLTILLCVAAPLLYFPFGWRWFRTNLPVSGLALLAALPMVGLCLMLGLRFWKDLRAP
jgi:hypothetical protein